MCFIQKISRQPASLTVKQDACAPVNPTANINEDNGTHHRFVGHARSTMTFRHAPEGDPQGRIDWNYLHIDGEQKGKGVDVVIYLYFNEHRLVRFDGVHELCDQAIELLEENGFDATYAKI